MPSSRTLLVLLALGACSGDPASLDDPDAGPPACDAPEARWALGAWRINGLIEDEGAQVLARTAAGGETIAVISDPFNAVRFGDRELAGPHLARIGRDGEILEIAVVPDVATGTSAAAMEIDLQGRVVIVWGYQSPVIVAYDAELAPRWSVTSIGAATEYRFAVGANGQVAFRSISNSGEGETLHYLGEDGVERWAVPLTEPYRYPVQIVVTGDGDVVAYGGYRRWRHASFDGAIVEDVTAPAVVLARPDGVALAIEGTSLTMLEPSGVGRWIRVVEELSTAPIGPGGVGGRIAIGPGDDVFAVTYQPLQIIQLAGASGEPRGTVAHCRSPTILDVDDDGYLTIGPVGSSSPGLVKYPAPG